MTAAITQWINTYVKPIEHPVRAWSSGVKMEFDVYRWMKGNRDLGDSLHGLFLETLDSVGYLYEFDRVVERVEKSLTDNDRENWVFQTVAQMRRPLFITLGTVTVLNGFYYSKHIHQIQPLSTLATAAHRHIPLIKVIINLILSSSEYHLNLKEQCSFVVGSVSYTLRALQLLPQTIIHLMKISALFRTAVIVSVGSRFEQLSKTTFFAYNFFIIPQLISAGNTK